MNEAQKPSAVVIPVDGQVRPRAWTLQSELDAGDSTCGAHLWFVNPRNSSWAPLYDQAALDAWRTAAHEAAKLSRHMHNRNAALMLLISDLGAVMSRMGAGIDHLDRLAREWEPDHSSCADRAGWVRAKDAADEARRLIASIPGRMKA